MSRQILKKAGRPRDENARVKILQSALKLLFERGHQNTTIKDIALEAGVGKQTIYRWWANKAELLMETLLFYADKYVDQNVLNKSKLIDEEELCIYLITMFGSLKDEIKTLLKSLIAEGISNKEFLKTFFDTFIKKRQEFLFEFLSNLNQFKNCSANKINLIVDTIFGTLWYRLIFEHRPLDKEFAKSLVHHLFEAGK
jgi:AcrR family transcriptional regulator